jgi:hypothetical protein
MKAISYTFGLFLVVVLALHLSMNGKVGATLGNPRVGNALFWSTGWQSDALAGLKQVNPVLLTDVPLAPALSSVLPGCSPRSVPGACSLR